MAECSKALARIAEIATGGSDPRAGIEQVAAEIATMFDSGMASILVADGDGHFRHVSGFGVPPNFVRRLEEAGAPDWEAVLAPGRPRPLIIEDAQRYSGSDAIARWATSAGVYTLALAPLQSGGRSLGFVAIYHQARREYSEDECCLLQSAAALTTGLVTRAYFTGDPGGLRSQLFSVLSHELRTPLTSIMGFTQILRKRLRSSPSTDQRVLEQLDVLWAQAQRLNRLIDTFVDMARIERGEFEINRGKVELGGIIRSAAEQAVTQASARHTFEMDIPDKPLWLHGDAKRLEQVFNSIISNAVRYSPEERPIMIECRERSAEAKVDVTITDRGPGIPPARLAELMERPYAAGPLKSGGLGVGLYLSKVIVEAHGGNLSVESTPDQGTSVFVTLPV